MNKTIYMGRWALSIITVGVMACSDHTSQTTLQSCAGMSSLDIPSTALFGQWRESEFLEMRTSTGMGYWIRKNHVLSREGQLTTREEVCADESCLDIKAELTHFGTFTFDAEHGTILKSYRKHFFSALNEGWMKTHFALEKCKQPLPSGEVVPLEHAACLDVLGVKSQETWKVEGATLRSLALRNCGPKLRAQSQATRELVRMF